MSGAYQYNGSRMESSKAKPGSVARARIQAEEKQQRAMQRSGLRPIAESEPLTTSTTRYPKQRAAIPQHQGGAGKMISRPSPMPQSSAGNAPTSASYRPPLSRPSQAPQRPPRPSRIPSMVDQSRLQEPTPLFFAPENPVSSQRSKIGTAVTTNQQKKTSVLGPPPSSRRGATSFYSNASLVSPIIEESLHSRSHDSYASSTVLPENWTSKNQNNRNDNADTFYEESMTDRNSDSIFDEYGDESRLVNRSELDSVPIVLSSSVRQSMSAEKHNTNDMNEMSNMKDIGRGTQGNSISATEIIQAYTAASSTVPPRSQPAQDPSIYSRSMNNGLRIDIDAVREAESRGSLTSLSELIRRATRLASMIEKGNRPASRLDNFGDYLGEKQTGQADHDNEGGRPHSGLSDMLASFPPPAAPSQPNNGANRSSWFGQGGWPFTSSANKSPNKYAKNRKIKRRCCGLPLWAAILATVLLLCIVVAAIVVPLELFVFNKSGSSQANNSIDQCRNDLPCRNGGSNVISSGLCACICTNGFTGNDCSNLDLSGCTTTDLVSTDGSTTIRDVTLGQSLPRLIVESNSNFSVPLSGTSVLAKINTNGLSCNAQNSLVTFNGRSSQSSIARRAAQSRQLRYSSSRLKTHASNEARESDTEYSRLASSKTNVAGLYGRASDDETFLAIEKVSDFCRIAVLYVLQEKNMDSAQDTQTDIQSFFNKFAQRNLDNDLVIPRNDATNITLGNFGSINLDTFNIDLGQGLVGENARPA